MLVSLYVVVLVFCVFFLLASLPQFLFQPAGSPVARGAMCRGVGAGSTDAFGNFCVDGCWRRRARRRGNVHVASARASV